MTDHRKFMDDYSRGMEMLRLSGRAFANLVTSLGYPIPNEKIPTAQVQLNMDEDRIEFVINPNYIADKSDSEIAAVLAHETYHVILDHLSELADVERFPKRPVLIDAQECIINDSLPSSVGFTTPAGTYRGMERHGQDFSNFSSEEGYEFILNKKKEEEEQKEEQNDSSEGSEEDENNSSDSGEQDEADSGDQEQENSEDGKEEDSEGGSDDQEDSDEEGAGNGDSDEDSDGEEQGDSNGAGDSEDSDDQEGESDGSGGEGSDGDSGDESEGCHGVVIVGEGSDDPEAVKKSLAKAIKDALDDVDMDDLPTDVQEALEDMAENGMDIPLPSYSIGTPNNGFAVIDPYAALNTNWRALLELINPKMKQAGRPKVKDSWHAPRRRMVHSYPEVILPTRTRLDDPNKKGDSIPSFVIALDMSVSIPERLLVTLAGFAMSVPEKLIKAYPITWSDGYKEFDPKQPRNIVYRGNTNIAAVMDYTRKVEAETGTKPYVLVITDGRYNIPSAWDPKELKERWFFMGIEPGDEKNIMYSTGRYTEKDRVFDINKFI